MNRQLATITGLTAAILSLSACNVVDVARYDPIEVVQPQPVEGAVPAVLVACEGAACPTPPPVSYPCVSGEAEGAITEGAGSVICP